MVEVKTRFSHRAGTALDSITDAKMATIDQLAQRYFYEKGLTYPEYHLDVIAIEVHQNGRATLKYVPDIQ